MTNGEKYANEILDIVCTTGVHPAVLKGKPVKCTGGDQCNRCFFNYFQGCWKHFSQWAQKEYKDPEIDWSKVPIDTEIFVSNTSKNGPWRKAHFAKVQNGLILVFSCGRTSWTALEDNVFSSFSYADIPNQKKKEKYLKYD